MQLTDSDARTYYERMEVAVEITTKQNKTKQPATYRKRHVSVRVCKSVCRVS